MDRNIIYLLTASAFLMSLSARRAWIEMLISRLHSLLVMSLSARRAWIEMWVLRNVPLLGIVALRKESVDRNTGSES